MARPVAKLIAGILAKAMLAREVLTDRVIPLLGVSVVAGSLGVGCCETGEAVSGWAAISGMGAGSGVGGAGAGFDAGLLDEGGAGAADATGV